MAETDGKVIYQYKLLRKIRIRAFGQNGYVLLPMIYGGVVHGAGHPGVWLWLIGALCVYNIVYFFITVGLLVREEHYETYRQKYRIRFWSPWHGFIPVSGVPFRQFCGIQFQLLIVCVLLLACFFVWLPVEATATACFAFIWSIGPRLWVMALMWRASSAGSVVVFGKNDVALYAP